MTPESEALLNAMVPSDGKVSTDLTDAVYDLLAPLHDILAKTEAHFTALDALRIAADRVEDNPQVYGWFERFKQSIDAGRRLNADAKRSIEAISDLCFQLDTYAKECKDGIGRIEVKEKYVVKVPQSEYEALLATRKEQDARLAEALTELNALKGD